MSDLYNPLDISLQGGWPDPNIIVQKARAGIASLPMPPAMPLTEQLWLVVKSPIFIAGALGVGWLLLGKRKKKPTVQGYRGRR